MRVSYDATAGPRVSGRNASPAAKADVWLTARAGALSKIGLGTHQAQYNFVYNKARDLSFAYFAYRPCCVLTVMSSKWGCFGLRWHVLGRLDVKSESRRSRLLRLHGGLDRHVSRLQPPRGPCQRLRCSVRGVRAWRFGAACEQAVRSGSICAGHRGRKMGRGIIGRAKDTKVLEYLLQRFSTKHASSIVIEGSTLSSPSCCAAARSPPSMPITLSVCCSPSSIGTAHAVFTASASSSSSL